MAPTIHVCSRGDVAKMVNATGARFLVSLSGPGDPAPSLDQIESHLALVFSDVAPDGAGGVAPRLSDVAALLSFSEGWDRGSPLVIHCWRGVSRSPAAAFIVACALYPGMEEARFARALRRASPSARPNEYLVSLADDFLQRGGGMCRAVRGIGRPGLMPVVARPFSIALPA